MCHECARQALLPEQQAYRLLNCRNTATGYETFRTGARLYSHCLTASRRPILKQNFRKLAIALEPNFHFWQIDLAVLLELCLPPVRWLSLRSWGMPNIPVSRPSAALPWRSARNSSRTLFRSALLTTTPQRDDCRVLKSDRIWNTLCSIYGQIRPHCNSRSDTIVPPVTTKRFMLNI
eukprot:scaffold279005_cov37-Prasinocladus_malaysianus.AAC.1